MDWRQMMGDIFKHRERTSSPGGASASEEGVRRFLQEVAVPAFEEVCEELARHGREGRLVRETESVSLSVYDPEGKEEFFYGIRAHCYRKLSFAFPEIAKKDPPKSQCRAEVFLRSGPAHFDVTGYNKEQLIRQFLHEYRKWIGWQTPRS